MTVPGAVTPHDDVRTIAAALKAVQKSNRGAPGYARWVNRRLGRYAAAVAYRRGLTPNQVTAVSAALTFSGVALIAVLPARFWAGALIFVLLATGFALDAADGQLARLRGGGSPTGEWLDHVVDSVKVSSLHAAVLITWYRHFDFDERWLLVPVAFGVQYTMFYFCIMLTEQLRRSAQQAGTRPVVKTGEPAPVLRSIIVLPADYGVLCLLFLLLGWHAGFAVVYGALFAANLVFTIGALPNWYRDIAALGAAR